MNNLKKFHLISSRKFSQNLYIFKIFKENLMNFYNITKKVKVT